MGGAGRATLRAEAVPIAARIAQFAEFMEVAHRVGGIAGGDGARPPAGGQAVRPGAGGAAVRPRREEILGGLGRGPGVAAVIAAEPALAVELLGGAT